MKNCEKNIMYQMMGNLEVPVRSNAPRPLCSLFIRNSYQFHFIKSKLFLFLSTPSFCDDKRNSSCTHGKTNLNNYFKFRSIIYLCKMGQMEI